MRQFNSNAWPVLSTTAVDYVLLKDGPLSPVYAYWDSRTQLEKAIVAYIDYYYNRRIKLKLNGLRPVQYRIQTVQIAKFLFYPAFRVRFRHPVHKILCSSCTRSPITMGLDKKPFMPLSKALRRSSSKALAVMARIGSFARAGSSSARI